MQYKVKPFNEIPYFGSIILTIVLIAEGPFVNDVEGGGGNGRCHNCCGEVEVLSAAVEHADTDDYVYEPEVDDAEYGDAFAGLMVVSCCNLWLLQKKQLEIWMKQQL